ncbi:MAG TPA: dethiobiotin synthase [Xanthobacteraceae bacterium]|nr:dethiobiotin synthase [Xanthobacteraceae bacterium]
MSAFFVTATGTDIGKTFVTCGLIRRLRAAGRAVDALKPVVSGFDPEKAELSDPGLLIAALGKPVSLPEIERISPWRFAAPLSPDVAAKREGRAVDSSTVADFCRRAIVAQGGTLLIEGVGGIMVPLAPRYTVLDLMIELGLPLIVVTGSYLGTISHTLSALDVLGRRGLQIAALVVNETAGSTVPLEDAVESIRPFAPSTEIVALPRLPAGATDHPVFAKLAARL